MTQRTTVPLLALWLILLLVPSYAAAQGAVQLPATGQSQTYHADDDGALQKGVVWPVPRFTDNSNGTITDNLTGRIWLKNGNCAQVTDTWQAALDYVTELNNNGSMNGNACGDTSNSGSHQTDWRLPNVLELESLLNLDEPVIAQWLNSQGFENVPFGLGDFSERYWSSTTYRTDVGDDREHAWTVQVTEGRVRHEDKATTSRYIWAVRGGQ